MSDRTKETVESTRSVLGDRHVPDILAILQEVAKIALSFDTADFSF